jgi:heme exporter protein B
MKKTYFQIVAVFKKDIRSELRTRYAINALFLFVITSVTIIVFALSTETPSPDILAGIYWVVIFFSTMSGLSRIFVSEEEKGTTLLLQLTASPSVIYWGKFFYNILLSICLNLLVTLLYIVFFPSVSIISVDIFLVTVILGSIGFASGSTIIAAIIAKANTKGTLYPVLSFPILLPLIITVIGATSKALEGEPFSAALSDFQVIFSYFLVLSAGSFLLFDYIWKD